MKIKIQKDKWCGMRKAGKNRESWLLFNILRLYSQFLEELADYENWGNKINYRTINKRFYTDNNPWNDKHKIRGKFRELFEKFKDSILVVSYRSDGIPSIEQIVSDVKLFKKRVQVYNFDNYKYVLSNGRTSEILIVGG
jgi:hypothetical protein